MSKFEIVKKETIDTAIEIAGTFFPPAAVAKSVSEWKENISNNIFLEKLCTILEKPLLFSTDWGTISEKFHSDADGYEENVKQLIFTVNAINELKALDVYANLLNAYSLDLLNKDEFFRLTWVLNQVFYQDLLYLKECYNVDCVVQNSVFTSLFNCGLLDVYTPQLRIIDGNGYEKSEDDPFVNKFQMNKSGLLMLACGLDYDNYSDYRKAW